MDSVQNRHRHFWKELSVCWHLNAISNLEECKIKPVLWFESDHLVPGWGHCLGRWSLAGSLGWLHSCTWHVTNQPHTPAARAPVPIMECIHWNCKPNKSSLPKAALHQGFLQQQKSKQVQPRGYLNSQKSGNAKYGQMEFPQEDDGSIKCSRRVGTRTQVCSWITPYKGVFRARHGCTHL